MANGQGEDIVTSLAHLQTGESATIGFVGDGTPTMRRLLALGFVAGTHVEVIRVAPLGDPTEYALRGSRISLRSSEARKIPVTRHNEG